MVNARDRFIEENLPLVHSLCKRFCGRGIEYDDLYQAGCVGLIKAADGFDKERGLCFSTYAVPVILGEVKRLFRDGGTIKISRGLKELSLKVNRMRKILSAELMREPTVSEIAERLGVDCEAVSEAVACSTPILSLTQSGEEGDSQIDVPVPSIEDTLSNKLLIDRALNELDETERKIIELRYFKFLTQNETAQQLNLSQVQISRAEKKILKKLRGIIGTVA